MATFGIAAEKRKMKIARLFAIFLGLSLLTRAILLPVPIIDVDEAAHITGSWELMRGKLLYTDFVDNKPPLLYVYYALAQLVFGRGMAAVHLFTALLTIPLTAFAVSAFFDHDRPGAIAGVVYLIYSASFLGHDMLSTNAEIVMMLPATLAIVLVKNQRQGAKPLALAASGALIGIAFLAKYQAVFWLPVAMIAALQQSPRSKALLPVLGFAAPIGMTWAVFAMAGGEQNLVRWTLLQNFAYTANPIQLGEALQRFCFKFLPFLAVTSFLWWGSYRSRALLDVYQRRLLGALLLFSLPAAFLGFRFFPHYFIQLYVPLALASAAFFSTLLVRPLSLQAKSFLCFTIFAFVGFTVANGILYYGENRVYEERDPAYREVSEFIRKDGPSGATLFVWGFSPEFYYYADLEPASRFVLPQTTLTGYVAGNTYNARGHADANSIDRRDWDLLINDLEKNRATYIVDTAPARLHRWNYFPIEHFPQFSAYIRKHYKLIASIDDVKIYKRISL